MSWDAMRRRLVAAGVLAESSLHLQQGIEVIVTEMNCIDENENDAPACGNDASNS
jgi:hypothetical protein